VAIWVQNMQLLSDHLFYKNLHILLELEFLMMASCIWVPEVVGNNMRNVTECFYASRAFCDDVLNSNTTALHNEDLLCLVVNEIGQSRTSSTHLHPKVQLFRVQIRRNPVTLFSPVVYKPQSLQCSTKCICEFIFPFDKDFHALVSIIMLTGTLECKSPIFEDSDDSWLIFLIFARVGCHFSSCNHFVMPCMTLDFGQPLKPQKH
jgi:hypothetical protein